MIGAVISVAVMFGDGQQIGRFERQHCASMAACQAHADAFNARSRALVLNGVRLTTERKCELQR